MRIEIRLTDVAPDGKFVGMKGLRCPSLRVFREAGDKVRLNNLAPQIELAFRAATSEIIRQARVENYVHGEN